MKIYYPVPSVGIMGCAKKIKEHGIINAVVLDVRQVESHQFLKAQQSKNGIQEFIEKVKLLLKEEVSVRTSIFFHFEIAIP